MNTEVSSFIVKLQLVNVNFKTEHSIKAGKSCESIISPISKCTHLIGQCSLYPTRSPSTLNQGVSGEEQMASGIIAMDLHARRC